MRKLLIVNADDLGLSEATNIGIETAHRKGILTSASLFASNPGFSHALKVIKRNPKLGIGIHLSLTLGKPVLAAKDVPDLVDSDGDFLPSFTRLIYKSLTDDKFMSQAEKELKAQVEKIKSKAIRIDHINGQQHFHAIPKFFPIVEALAKKYHLKMRYPKENFYLAPSLDNLIKYLLVKFMLKFDKKPNNNRFYGLLHTGKMNQYVLSSILPNIKPGVTEVLFHPAYYSKKNKKLFDKQKATAFMANKHRIIEIKTLTSKKTKNLLEKYDIMLTTYSQI